MKKLIILLLSLCVCLLAACAKENQETGGTSVTSAPVEISAPETTGAPETAAPAEPTEETTAPTEETTVKETATEEPTEEESSSEEPSTEPEGPLSPVSVSAQLHHDSVGHVWLQFIGAYENTGDTPLQLAYADATLSGPGVKDIVLSDLEPYPQVIAPGETGYYYEMKQVDLDSSAELTASLTPEFSPAEAPVRFEATENLVRDTPYGLEVQGTLAPEALKEEGMICVAAVLLDGDGVPFTVLYDYFTAEDIAQGFILSADQLPEGTLAADAAQCLIFAYPYEV